MYSIIRVNKIYIILYATLIYIYLILYYIINLLFNFKTSIVSFFLSFRVISNPFLISIKLIQFNPRNPFTPSGIDGNDLADGNPTLTLALIWQLMRAYTLAMLSQLAESGSPIVEAEIINWANSKLTEAGKKSSIRSFQDSSIANAVAIVDLVDAIKPGTINYDLMRLEGGEEVGVIFCIGMFSDWAFKALWETS